MAAYSRPELVQINMRSSHIVFLLPVALSAFCQKVVLTNDDGWATAQIRAQNNALKAAGFNVSSLLSSDLMRVS